MDKISVYGAFHKLTGSIGERCSGGTEYIYWGRVIVSSVHHFDHPYKVWRIDNMRYLVGDNEIKACPDGYHDVVSKLSISSIKNEDDLLSFMMDAENAAMRYFGY